MPETTTLDDFVKNNRTHWLPVDNPKHTEVLGSRVTTKYGKYNWDRLDWKNWWPDGPGAHIFNSGGSYFHVQVKKGGDDEGCVFRVRCWYAGGKYRGWPVKDIDIGMKDGKLHWIVRCTREAGANRP